MTHRPQEYRLGVVGLLRHQPGLAGFGQSGSSRDAQSHPVHCLRAVARNGVRKVPVENREFPRPGKTESESADRMSLDRQRQEDPRATRIRLTDGAKPRIAHQHFFERFEINRHAFLDSLGVWSRQRVRLLVLERPHQHIQRSGLAQQRQFLLRFVRDYDDSRIALESDYRLMQNRMSNSVLGDRVAQGGSYALQSGQAGSSSSGDRARRLTLRGAPLDSLWDRSWGRDVFVSVVQDAFEIFHEFSTLVTRPGNGRQAARADRELVDRLRDTTSQPVWRWSGTSATRGRWNVQRFLRCHAPSRERG